MHSAKTSMNIMFSPQLSPFTGDLPIFPERQTAQALLSSWRQVLHAVRPTCFSALIVLFHRQRNKSLVHLALLLPFLLSLYPLSLYAFPEKEATLLPAKPVYI